MTTAKFRYDKPPIPLVAEPPKTLDLTAEDITPLVAQVSRSAYAAGTSEEALATVVDLWDQLTALKTDEKELRRGRDNEHRRTSALLNAGQIMGLETAIGRHLERHAHLAPRRPKERK
jgi:hypothetical protein